MASKFHRSSKWYEKPGFVLWRETPWGHGNSVADPADALKVLKNLEQEYENAQNDLAGALFDEETPRDEQAYFCKSDPDYGYELIEKLRRYLENQLEEKRKRDALLCTRCWQQRTVRKIRCNECDIFVCTACNHIVEVRR